MTFRLLCTAAVVAALSTAADAAVPLPALNVDTSQITVSGLSAGGFMANQLGYAYSATFKGVGVFAGGPYMCAGHSNYTACMYNATISASMLSTMQADINNWSGSANDNKANVAGQKIFMFVGTSDFTVGPNPMNAVQTQYTNNGVPAANLEYVKRASTAHVFPTDFDSTGNNACGSSASPYISNCGYDGAKAALTKFYGALNPRNNGGQLHRVRPDRLHHQRRCRNHRLAVRAGELRGRHRVQAARGAARLPAGLRDHRRQVHQEHRLHAMGRHQQHHRAVPAGAGRQQQPRHLR
jgi:hypothetical protein